MLEVAGPSTEKLSTNAAAAGFAFLYRSIRRLDVLLSLQVYFRVHKEEADPFKRQRANQSLDLLDSYHECRALVKL